MTTPNQPRSKPTGGDAVSEALEFGVKKDFFADQNPRKSFNRSSVARFGTFTGFILGKKIF